MKQEIKQYLETLDDTTPYEKYMTSKKFAEIELNNFLEYLENEQVRHK